MPTAKGRRRKWIWRMTGSHRNNTTTMWNSKKVESGDKANLDHRNGEKLRSALAGLTNDVGAGV